MSDYSVNQIEELPYFKGCSKDHLALLACKLRRRALHMGELIMTDQDQPECVYFLISGEVRQQCSDTRLTQSRFTVALHKKPFIAGLASLHAGAPVEFLTAATDIELAEVSITDWKYLLDETTELSSYVSNYFSEADLWPIIKNRKDLHLPTSLKELRLWVTRLSKETSVSWINQEETRHPGVLSEQTWIIASNSRLGGYGEILEFKHSDSLGDDNIQKTRIVKLPDSIWLRNPYFQLSSPRKEPDSASGRDIKRAENLETINNETLQNKSSFKFFGSPEGEIPEAVACFRSIAHELRLPLKVDLLKRVLEEQSTRGSGCITLELCASISESLGLQTQLLKLPLGLINRLKTPCIAHLMDGELCVGLATRNDEILLSRPRSGIERFKTVELEALCNEDKTLSVLVLHRTERTPEKKFGLAWFLPAIKKNKKPLLEVLIASLFVQLFQLMNPLIVQQIIDKVIGQNGMGTLPVLAVLLFSFSIFENLLTAVRTNLFIDTTNRIDISLGEQIIDHLLRLPLNYFDRRPVGELSSRLGELEQIRSFLTGTALTVVMDSIFSAIYILVMLFYSWILTIVALLVAPILAVLTFSTSPVIRRQLRTKAELNAKTQNHLVEVLTGIQTVKAQNFELKARWRWKERYSNYVAEGFRNAVTATATNGLTQFLNQVSVLSILCVGAYLVLQGQLTLGQLIAFRIISGYVTGPLLRLSNLYQSFQQTSISLERLADIVDTPQESTDVDRKNIPLATIQGRVIYEDLSFRFGKDGPLQLAQINLDIPAGEFVAIVGQSGSGKSTLTKLLPRLYAPQTGRILIDDTDISKVELYSLRRQIGIVPQDSLLFEGSVQDNIALSNPEATSEEIIAAARVACAHEFIMGLPSGYASSVGERGGGLSGGQRQRIAIARTVLQNPRLLIMDEATSALDYQTERLVSLNLMEHFRGKTVLFITHRLNSIVHADRIIMMHQGRVEEQGTHDELMKLRGRYSALFRQQENGH